MTDADSGALRDGRVLEWIDRLELMPHPEGGWFRETFRSEVVFSRAMLPDDYSGDRVAMTSILFLLPTGMRSRWHRVRSEELWMHQHGDDLRLGLAEKTIGSEEPTRASEVRLGQGPTAQLQARVPPGAWQEAEALPGNSGFALVGCVVAPGFEFEDFEMAKR